MSSTGLRWTEQEFADFNRRQNKIVSDPKLNKLRFAALKALVATAPHKLGRGQRVEIDGLKFATLAEARRYESLKLLEKAREIFFLQVHPSWSININGIHICRVVADFGYLERLSGNYIVEDIKRERCDKITGKVKFSTDTRHSKIGRKLLFAVHDVVVEVLK